MVDYVCFTINKLPNISNMIEELVSNNLETKEIIETILQEQGAVFKIILKDDLRQAMKGYPSDFDKIIKNFSTTNLTDLINEKYHFPEKNINLYISQSFPGKYRLDRKSIILYLREDKLKDYVKEYVSVEEITI